MTDTKEKVLDIRLASAEEKELAEKLLNEVGELPNVNFSLGQGFPTQFSDDIPDRPTAIRGIIRDATLMREEFKLGNPGREETDLGTVSLFRWSDTVIGRDVSNEKIYRGHIDKSPAAEYIKELIIKPVMVAYKWQDVAYWDLGNFNQLRSQLNPRQCLLITECGVMLFSDELKQLSRGEKVLAKDFGGLGMGWITSSLDTFGVFDGNLYRVWASLSD